MSPIFRDARLPAVVMHNIMPFHRTNDQTMHSSPNRRFALAAAQVWDGVSDRPEPAMAVVVNGESIEQVVPVHSVPSNIEMVRFPESSMLLPGLIDAHIHYSPWMGPAFLAAGVTTVRDTGNDLDWILAQQARNRSDLLAGPEIVSCGLLLDGPKPYWHFIGRGHPNTNALRESIREEAKRGLRSIKFYDGLDQEFIEAGVREAREHGLWVLADFGTDEPKAEPAVRAGVNEIEHLTGCPPAWHTSSQDEKDRLIDVLLEQDVVMTSTLITYDHLGRALELPYWFDSRLAWVHPTFRDIWKRIPEVGKESRREQREHFQEASVNQKRFVRRLHQRGVKLAIGTDTPFQFIIPGFSVHDEVSMNVEAGVPPVDALRSATSVNAALLGLEKQIGQIKPGFLADLIVVSGNPFENIHDIANIECVARKGAVLPQDELRQRSAAECERTLDDPITRDLHRYLASTRAAQKPVI